MNKKSAYIFAILILLSACHTDNPYDPSIDAKKVIHQSVVEAKSINVPVILIFGANWCPDCRALSQALTTGNNATKIAKAFKVVKINVGNFDENLDIAKSYGNPIEIGIPGAAFLSTDSQLIYVAKAEELAKARIAGDDGLYTFFNKVTQQIK